MRKEKAGLKTTKKLAAATNWQPIAAIRWLNTTLVRLSQSPSSGSYQAPDSLVTHPAFSGAGVVYDLGQGVPQNTELAIRYYELAAAQNHASAMFNLGYLYDTGESTLLNHAEARKYYHMAADHDHAAAWYVAACAPQRRGSVACVLMPRLPT